MTTTTTATGPAQGATVWLIDPETEGPSRRFPGEWTVDKINPRTIKVSQGADGGPRRIVNADRSLISSTPPAAASLAQDARIPWAQGQLVYWDAAPAEKTGGTLFVIITDHGDRTVDRIVLLGNTTGRYWKRVPAADLRPVSAADLLRPEVPR